jgi:NADPH-dependent curcumin reductase CurA
MRNRRVVLSSRPAGIAQAEHFRIEEVDVPPLADGEVLVRNAYLSVEPAMRGWIADPGNYAAPVGIGETMRALASGYVLASRSPRFREGDTVSGWLGWQEHAVVEAHAIELIDAADLRLALGLLGINGLTAYLALTRVGSPKAGETVLVSSAAGAVGSAVGQIAALLGCRTVGLAGGADKTELCRTAFGYDAAID